MKTAIDLLIEQLPDIYSINKRAFEIIQVIKVIEERQIKIAYMDGKINLQNQSNIDSEEYFKMNYKNE